MKANVEKIDVDKLKTVLFDLINLSNVVDNDIVEKIWSQKLVLLIPNTTGLVSKTK